MQLLNEVNQIYLQAKGRGKKRTQHSNDVSAPRLPWGLANRGGKKKHRGLSLFLNIKSRLVRGPGSKHKCVGEGAI